MLGPVLFLCHINDVPVSVKSQVRLLADDSLLYRSMRTFNDSKILQHELDELEKWALKWRMHFNPKKCYLIRICRGKVKFNCDYFLCQHKLQQNQINLYLGLNLSADIKWTTHINAICAKANCTLGFLRRNLRNCPTKLKELSYFALIR